MLEPDSRSLLLDALRPPDGYQLDRAIGTTFSLDLNTLLTAPLAFAMFDAELAEDEVPDVIALLEATRRYAGRISLFCQAGRIALPAKHQPVFANLEGTVHESVAPDPVGVFHPKVWALRYVSPDGDEPRFRLLVLSRNLTFDRSWDTILRLDGTRAGPSDRPAARLRNMNISWFLRQLPDTAVRPLPHIELEAIEDLASQFSEVAFELPRGVSDIDFWPFGFDNVGLTPIEEEHDRVLIISPFLSESILQETVAHGSGHMLVSRSEALDRIPLVTLGAFDKVYVLDAAAEGSDAEPDENALSGLHAKTYVMNEGRHSRILTGSANATRAAFSRNVEFMVEMYGRRDRLGVDAIIGGDEDDSTLLDLLVPYSRSDDLPPEDAEAEALEHALDRFRHDIARIPLSINVQEGTSLDEYSLRIASESALPRFPDADVTCRPITLGSNLALPVPPGVVLDARFPKVSFAAISAFVAFDVTARRGPHTRSASFVVTTALHGAPENRHQRILSSVLSDKSKVLRYLLFLLSDPTSDPGTLGLLTLVSGTAGGSGNGGNGDVPLLETLLKALARDPSRLDPVHRLIADLATTEEGTQRLPSGIQEVWEPIWAIREELSGD